MITWLRIAALLGVVVLVYIVPIDAHEFTDKSGKLKVEGTLVAIDDKEVVIKLDSPAKGRELLAIAIDQLSEEDQKWIRSAESQDALASAGERNSWTLRNGTVVVGKIVDFTRREVSMQRRRGRFYVNDRLFDNLPEIDRKIIPRIVQEFDKQPMETDAQFQNWILAQRINVRTFTFDGVLMELTNGDEYAIPFFLFQESELRLLQPHWEEWLKAHTDTVNREAAIEQERQHALYLQSQAAAYQQNRAEMAQIARLQLQMTAVAAGVVDMWEVFMFPLPGTPSYPISVVVMARNSDVASQMALAQNPGFSVGPARRLNGRFRW